MNEEGQEFDPMASRLEDLIEEIRHQATRGGGFYTNALEAERAIGEREAAWLVEVLQARATLLAAESQRSQTRWLVFGTWALVVTTIALVVVTIVAT